MVIQTHIPPSRPSQNIQYLDTVWSHVFRRTSVTCDLPIFISHPAVNFKSSPYIPSTKIAKPVLVENIFIPHPQLKILSSHTPHLWLNSSYPLNLYWALLQIPYTHLQTGQSLLKFVISTLLLAGVWPELVTNSGVPNDITQGTRLKEATWQNSS